MWAPFEKEPELGLGLDPQRCQGQSHWQCSDLPGGLGGGCRVGSNSRLEFGFRSQKTVWESVRLQLRIPSCTSILAMEMSWRNSGVHAEKHWFLAPNPFFPQTSMVGCLKSRALGRVTVRSQEVPGAEIAAAQRSQRAELRVHVRVQVRLSL